MGTEFTFYDYVDDAGRNEVQEWINNLPTRDKAHVDDCLYHLEGTPKGNWRRPLADTLTDECDGLFEIRFKFGNILWRPLGFHGPKQKDANLLLIAKEVNNRFEPRNACALALERKEKVTRNPQKFRRKHDYRTTTSTSR